ncbi:MAG TPA: sugar phosphate isomerase/epimerase [Naasia sp.]|jgi:sugar phosphate isomerase/epimerase
MIRIGMSTTCAYPWSPERAFALAALAGFDGVEVMVTRNAVTQDAEALAALSARTGMPILSIHAPVLLLTSFVWGRDPEVKVRKSAELARSVGASSVVVHPPFRWQHSYADRFLDIVRATTAEYGVEIAVENMFPWRLRGSSIPAYAPGWDPAEMDCDAATLDFSHAALSGRDALQMAQQLGPRLRHVHLCDGSSSGDDGRIFDEHLPPGSGTQPVAETLAYLASSGWSGSIVAEVNTRRLRAEQDRLDLLRSTAEFAREHTRTTRPAGALSAGSTP